MPLISVRLQNLVRPLLTSVKERLDAQDLDQEVKECAISCTATMLAKLAESLQADVPALLQVPKTRCCYCAKQPCDNLLTLTTSTCG